MKILGIDSSSITASVAITENDSVVAENFINNGLTHSQTLMPLVENVLEKSKLNLSDIDFFAVTNGPGSFTGIRIGIASIKGICDALNKKCIPVSTLEAIAEPLRNEDVIACAVMDARCNQVYTASFYKGKRLCDDRAVLIDDLKEDILKYNKNTILIGDGAVLVYEKLKETVNNISLADEDIRYIKGSSVCSIATRMAEKHLEVTSQNLVPFYLRLPQAERELKNKNFKKD